MSLSREKRLYSDQVLLPPILTTGLSLSHRTKGIFLHRVQPKTPQLRSNIQLRPQRGKGLVLAGSGLAGLELLEVPAADVHVALVLVHALGEGLGGAGAVIAPGAVVLGGGGGSRGDSLGAGVGNRGGATAGEEAADGVADGGADSYTTTVCERKHSVSAGDENELYISGIARVERRERGTYAAVLAIWPKRPGPWDTGAATGGAAAGAEGAGV